eukprot:scaffold304434_cov28-Tisochrysis_lutea.AAC.3
MYRLALALAPREIWPVHGDCIAEVVSRGQKRPVLVVLCDDCTVASKELGRQRRAIEGQGAARHS